MQLQLFHPVTVRAASYHLQMCHVIVELLLLQRKRYAKSVLDLKATVQSLAIYQPAGCCTGSAEPQPFDSCAAPAEPQPPVSCSAGALVLAPSAGAPHPPASPPLDPIVSPPASPNSFSSKSDSVSNFGFSRASPMGAKVSRKSGISCLVSSRVRTRTLAIGSSREV